MDDQGGSAVPTLASLARESFYRLFADEAIPLVLPLALAEAFSARLVDGRHEGGVPRSTADANHQSQIGR